MADTLKKRGYAHPQLIASSGGAFEVKLGNILLFSKLQTGRFPEHVEIIELIEKANKT